MSQNISEFMSRNSALKTLKVTYKMIFEHTVAYKKVH